jgi:quercetin dioxygenase-like cupin family protein
MKAVKSIVVAVAFTAGTVMALSSWAGSAGEAPGFISVEASKLKWTDAPSVAPGAKMAVIEGDLKSSEPFTFRLKVPANSKIGVHTHPTTERVTVLSGTLYFAVGDKFDAAKGKAYKPGDAFLIPSGMPMYAYTKNGETIVQIHGTGPWGITYLKPEDAPGKKK